MIRTATLAAVVAVSAAACAADAPAPAAGSVASSAAGSAVGATVSVEAGRRAYISSCTRCHGINLVSTSSAYYDLRTFPKAEKERFVDSVTNGKRQMPAWGSVLKPEAVESIWLYVGSVNGW